MGRPGARVSRRKHKTGRVGFSHRVKREETMVSFSFFFSFKNHLFLYSVWLDRRELTFFLEL
jgi:hypothetical protein